MPIFTLDSSPEITEVDGKFTVNISDEVAKTMEDYNTVNSNLSTANNSIESFKSQIGAYGGVGPEDITLMQASIDAYKKDGTPDQLKLDLATASQANKTFQETIEALTGKVTDLNGFKNNTVIGGEIGAEMALILGDSAGQYKEVYKNWVNDFSLNSDGVPVTKEGFTVKQFLTNKVKEPGYSFMKQPSTSGGSQTPAGGGSGGGDTKAAFLLLVAKSQTPEGITIKEQMEMAKLNKQMKAESK